MDLIPKHLQDLNERQEEAVCYTKGPLLVFAGAGSGKTRVLTRRIAHLIYTKQAHPLEIFAVTFTNKAAREMISRISKLYQLVRMPMWVSTFHSACVRILRPNAKLLDFSPNFVIYDSNDSLSALKRVYKALKIDKNNLDPHFAINQIDNAKNKYLSIEDVRKNCSQLGPRGLLVAEVFEAYQNELHSNNAMDFGDLLCHALTLLKLNPSVRNRYQQQFKHILVDEYQDTNHVQYLLIRELAGENKNICVVGDDDQSIYAFRGATIQNILNFQKDYPDAKVVTLDINYRSTQTIVNAAGEIIRENTERQKKDIRTINSQGEKIDLYCAYNEADEAEFVATEVALLTQKGVKYNQIAVFYRTNAQSRSIEEKFISCNIPYEIYGGFRFYDRKEIKDILAYLRLIINDSDTDACTRIINTPSRGIGTTSMASLLYFAQKRSCPLFHAIKLAISEKPPFLTTSLAKKLTEFCNLIEELKEAAIKTEQSLKDTNMDISIRASALPELLEAIAKKSGYIKKLKDEDSSEAESRIENIQELIRVGQEFAERIFSDEENVSIIDFLDRAALSSDLDKNDKESTTKSPRNEDSVSLMTLHLAKGLEFEYVFMIGMEEGLLPHSRSIEENDIEEERRLCYVGVTRAKQKLFLCHALSRNTFGRSSWYSGIPSRFLESIDPNNINQRGI